MKTQLLNPGEELNLSVLVLSVAVLVVVIEFSLALLEKIFRIQVSITSTVGCAD